MMGEPAAQCEPCEGIGAKLNATQLAEQLQRVPEWELDGQLITRRFTFPNFAKALLFAIQIGCVAEEQGHHPDIALGWGYCTIFLTTHALNRLTQNDFIIATSIDQLHKGTANAE